MNWGDELGLYREHEDRKTTPAEALLARDKVRTRDPAPRQPIRLGLAMLLRKRVITCPGDAEP